MGKKSIYLFMVVEASNFPDLPLFAVENLNYQNNEFGPNSGHQGVPEFQIVD